ncbi:MAG: caspase family protein [Myxococcota bacterium]
MHPSSQAVEAAYQPRRFALLVGITEVEDERWRPLRFARKDAQDLAQVLSDPRRGDFTSVRVLTRKEETTRDAITRALDAVAQEASRPDDILVVYLSAHGTLGRDARGALARYVVTSDAQFHRVSTTALAVDVLTDRLFAAASHRRLLVLATCHSGSGKSLLPQDVEAELASLKGPPIRPLETASRAAMVLSASDFGETAREDETLQNDIYTHFLVAGLDGTADRNGDGAVSATEAHDYARRHTWVFSQGRQRPSAEILEVGADPVLLSGRVERTGRPELYSYAPRLDGFTLKVDGEERTELPGGAAVVPGAHSVELTKGGAVLWAEQVMVRSGDRVDLERLLLRRAPWRSLSLLGGGFGFLDASSQNEVLPASPSVGLSLRLHRVLLDRLSLSMDASGFRTAQRLRLGGPPVPFTATSVLAGAAVLYPWAFGRVSVWVGPRVAGLWVQRSFSLETYQAAQSASSITPGLMAGAGLELAGGWEVSVETQVMLTVLAVDGAPRVLGFLGGWAAWGYRF